MCLSYLLCRGAENPDFRSFRGFNEISEERLQYVCIWRRDILKQAGRRRRRRDIYVNPFLGTGFGGDLYLPWTKAHAGCAKLKHRKRSSHLSCQDANHSHPVPWLEKSDFDYFSKLSVFFQILQPKLSEAQSSYQSIDMSGGFPLFFLTMTSA